MGPDYALVRVHAASIDPVDYKLDAVKEAVTEASNGEVHGKVVLRIP